jgi:hypothetical protein
MCCLDARKYFGYYHDKINESLADNTVFPRLEELPYEESCTQRGCDSGQMPIGVLISFPLATERIQ